MIIKNISSKVINIGQNVVMPESEIKVDDTFKDVPSIKIFAEKNLITFIEEKVAPKVETKVEPKAEETKTEEPKKPAKVKAE